MKTTHKTRRPPKGSPTARGGLLGGPPKLLGDQEKGRGAACAFPAPSRRAAARRTTRCSLGWLPPPGPPQS
eukprot:3620318-Alexandrium_andersonii.AAC.1